MRHRIGIVCLLLFSAPVLAETVFLSDGSTIQGRITSQTRSEIVILTDRGVMHIDKARISRISFQDSAPDVNEKDRFDPAQVDEILKKRAERENLTERLGRERADNAALNIDDMKVSRWDYVWRSALLPGWGHIYGRQWKEGIGYSTAFVLTAAGGMSLYSGAVSSRKTYKSSIDSYYIGRNSFLATPQEHAAFLGFSVATIVGKENTYRKKVMLANLGLAGIGCVYVWQLAHAYWFGVSEERKDESLSFHVSPTMEASPSADAWLLSTGVATTASPGQGPASIPRDQPIDRGLDIGLTFSFDSNNGGAL